MAIIRQQLWTILKKISKFISTLSRNLYPLYQEIYINGNCRYWEELDKEISEYAKLNRLEYVYNNDKMNTSFNGKPIIVNFFYHEKNKEKYKDSK